MRAGSQRIPNKNIRPIANYRYGLLEIKLRQLVQCECFEIILIDTDIEQIEEIVDKLDLGCEKLRIERRPAEFAANNTTTDELIAYVLKKVESEQFAWTHVTSPFFTAAHYKSFMQAFDELGDEFDSLMTVNVLREFLWNDSGPLNYDRSKQRWPFTQLIDPVMVINSAAFAIRTDVAIEVQDRIGRRPSFFRCDDRSGFDIDWQDQFELAKLLISSGTPVI